MHVVGIVRETERSSISCRLTIRPFCTFPCEKKNAFCAFSNKGVFLFNQRPVLLCNSALAASSVEAFTSSILRVLLGQADRPDFSPKEQARRESAEMEREVREVRMKTGPRHAIESKTAKNLNE